MLRPKDHMTANTPSPWRINCTKKYTTVGHWSCRRIVTYEVFVHPVNDTLCLRRPIQGIFLKLCEDIPYLRSKHTWNEKLQCHLLVLYEGIAVWDLHRELDCVFVITSFVISFFSGFAKFTEQYITSRWKNNLITTHSSAWRNKRLSYSFSRLFEYT